MDSRISQELTGIQGQLSRLEGHFIAGPSGEQAPFNAMFSEILGAAMASQIATSVIQERQEVRLQRDMDGRSDKIREWVQATFVAKQFNQPGCQGGIDIEQSDVTQRSRALPPATHPTLPIESEGHPQDVALGDGRLQEAVREGFESQIGVEEELPAAEIISLLSSTPNTPFPVPQPLEVAGEQDVTQDQTHIPAQQSLAVQTEPSLAEVTIHDPELANPSPEHHAIDTRELSTAEDSLPILQDSADPALEVRLARTKIADDLPNPPISAGPIDIVMEEASVAVPIPEPTSLADSGSSGTIANAVSMTGNSNDDIGQDHSTEGPEPMEMEMPGRPAAQQAEPLEPQMLVDQASSDLAGAVLLSADGDSSGHAISQMETDLPAAVDTNITSKPTRESMDEPEEGEIDTDSEGSAIDFS